MAVTEPSPLPLISISEFLLIGFSIPSWFSNDMDILSDDDKDNYILRKSYG